MIIGIILLMYILKKINKMYKRSVAHNAELVGNYLYEIIKATNQ